MNITIVGIGYVGLSLAVLLSKKHNVVALDILQNKVKLINNKKSPFKDKLLEDTLKSDNLNLIATLQKTQAYILSSYIIICTPTNYDIETGSFDTSSVETTISDTLYYNKNACIVIKSTIPLGFTDRMRKKFNTKQIFFSPEFLRESKALHDNLYPSRIVIGDWTDDAIRFGKILLDCSKLKPKDVKILHMNSQEAEAVKLFSNSYLAMRVSFFNELDSFTEINNLSSERIINGVSSDPRIGNFYNNPSFGYGGYCLPKDTKQLLDSFKKVPNEIIKAVVSSNQTRKTLITNSILKKNARVIGVYRLQMKEGSDNFRESAIIDIIKNLIKAKVKVILHEPLIKEKFFDNIEVINDLKKFITLSNLIIANRLSNDLDHVREKVYSRDIFNEN